MNDNRIKPVIQNDTVILDNLILFVKNTILKYYKILTVLVFLNLVLSLLPNSEYKASTSFYTNYEETNSTPSAFNFLRTFGKTSNDLGFSVNDYVKSNKFLDDIIYENYSTENGPKNLLNLMSKGYDRKFSINPISTILIFNRNSKFNSSVSDDEKKLTYVREGLREIIAYSEDEETGLHILSIDGLENESLAIQINKKAFSSIVNYSNEVTNLKGKEKREFIDARLNDVKADLDEAEIKMLKFLENNKNLNSPSLILIKERLQRDLELQNQLFLSLSNELELAKINEKDSTSSVFLLDQTSISPYQTDRGIIESIIILCIMFGMFCFTFEIIKNRDLLFK